jgi:16S rRNA (guanine966-N2)-methyltransferase
MKKRQIKNKTAENKSGALKPGPLKPGSLRIIAGAWRGRSIEVPPGKDIRPTSDRVREALFNRLAHAFADQGFQLHGARIVDVFAGTGALGLEALSRGAAQAVLLDRNPQAIALLKRNVAKLGAEDRATIMNADGTNLPRAATACNLAFLDPPYGENLVTPALQSLARQGWLASGALVTVETDEAETVAEAADYARLDRRSYGRVAITFLRYTP